MSWIDLDAVESAPTPEQVWFALQLLYGKDLIGCTVVAILATEREVKVKTTSFPVDEKSSPGGTRR